MKKLNIILTLLVSSFFLFSTNVKADTITFEVSESEMAYLTNEDFLLLREKTIEYCEENDMYYVINFNGSVFTSRIFEIIEMNVGLNTSINNIYISPTVSFKNYRIVDGILTEIGSGTGTIGFGSKNSFTYINFLDSNIENLSYTGSVEFIIQYNGLSYSISSGSILPTLYDIYLDYNETQVPEKDPKAEIVSNFYTVVIQKIELLANLVVSNYVILSSLVIFIFVSALCLFRRLL